MKNDKKSLEVTICVNNESYTYGNISDWEAQSCGSTHLNVTLKFNDGDDPVTILLGSGHTMIVSVQDDEET